MLKFIRKFLKNTKGATAIEYALIASLIAVACITAFTGVGTKLSAMMDTISTALTPPTP
jgi:pilus assembly protein Flp/PilA